MAKQSIDTQGFCVTVIPYGVTTRVESLQDIPTAHLTDEGKESVECLKESQEKQLSQSWSGAQSRPLPSSSFTFHTMLRNKRKKEEQEKVDAEVLAPIGEAGVEEPTEVSKPKPAPKPRNSRAKKAAEQCAV